MHTVTKVITSDHNYSWCMQIWRWCLQEAIWWKINSLHCTSLCWEI